MKKAKKLPKRLAGVKLSKQLRKAGGKLLRAANSPVGREILVTGLGLAAAAAAAAAEKKRAPGGADDQAKPADKPAGGRDPHDIGVQLGRMAEAALAGLFSGKRG
jgi:hypothetical protein